MRSAITTQNARSVAAASCLPPMSVDDRGRARRGDHDERRERRHDRRRDRQRREHAPALESIREAADDGEHDREQRARHRHRRAEALPGPTSPRNIASAAAAAIAAPPLASANTAPADASSVRSSARRIRSPRASRPPSAIGHPSGVILTPNARSSPVSSSTSWSCTEVRSLSAIAIVGTAGFVLAQARGPAGSILHEPLPDAERRSPLAADRRREGQQQPDLVRGRRQGAAQAGARRARRQPSSKAAPASSILGSKASRPIARRR